MTTRRYLTLEVLGCLPTNWLGRGFLEERDDTLCLPNSQTNLDIVHCELSLMFCHFMTISLAKRSLHFLLLKGFMIELCLV